ncbi:hypothetical protein FRACYDRAFT_233257 [Fragilariopsis cylindrus CCMP1102]|uniref:P-loop containing nucleoside triphosphate hydrolase protein n=1 Tax=Fragilariopsis cylindrus CCMP1102 TaxID=635003 RepID=A0A1E7FY63_9STRA|nr:hypothetical protein FRACYDRAFT_233257 [Fragilariopsis cylindrus CCMP1102]|eukprot:OEU23091.1 hypothetical protein FRACYDRAFT_233257 [Fragilariopsis cylindrus CCMP1102]
MKFAEIDSHKNMLTALDHFDNKRQPQLLSALTDVGQPDRICPLCEKYFSSTTELPHWEKIIVIYILFNGVAFRVYFLAIDNNDMNSDHNNDGEIGKVEEIIDDHATIETASTIIFDDDSSEIFDDSFDDDNKILCKTFNSFKLGGKNRNGCVLSIHIFTNNNKLQRHNHENISANKTIRRDELPTFVLHVGPQKSGTTAIQKELHAPHMKQLLRQDNFTVIDDDIIRKKHLNFLTTTSNGTIFEFPKDFVKVVEKQRKVPGQNIFGSSEFLRVPNDRQCQAWNNMFMSPVDDEIDKSDGQKWNLHVVITYRRLHSYLPSGWNQKYKLFRINRRPVHLHHQNWPGVKGDYRIPSFDEWFVEKYYGQSHHLHLAQVRYSAWKKCSDEIIIVNIHDLNVHGVDSDLTTNFVCKALKGATLHAYENELIGVDPKHAIDNALYRRDHVTLKVQEHADSNGIALPMKCPNSTVLDFIYDWSLKSEQWAFSVMQNHNANSTEMGVLHPDVIENQPLTKERLSNFNNDWEKSLAEKKFCNVDFVETLKQKEWQKFFRNLSY